MCIQQQGGDDVLFPCINTDLIQCLSEQQSQGLPHDRLVHLCINQCNLFPVLFIQTDTTDHPCSSNLLAYMDSFTDSYPVKPVSSRHSL